MSQAGKFVIRASNISVMQERAADALRSGALHTYKQQISFGLHVIVMMGTFFAVGYIAGTALSPNMAVVGVLTSAIGEPAVYGQQLIIQSQLATQHADMS